MLVSVCCLLCYCVVVCVLCVVVFLAFCVLCLVFGVLCLVSGDRVLVFFGGVFGGWRFRVLLVVVLRFGGCLVLGVLVCLLSWCFGVWCLAFDVWCSV